MSKEKDKKDIEKHKQEKSVVTNGDSLPGSGGELHQLASGGHPELTTNQGVAISDNQNSLRAQSAWPDASGGFHTSRKNYTFRSRAYSRAYRACTRRQACMVFSS